MKHPQFLHTGMSLCHTFLFNRTHLNEIPYNPAPCACPPACSVVKVTLAESDSAGRFIPARKWGTELPSRVPGQFRNCVWTYQEGKAGCSHCGNLKDVDGWHRFVVVWMAIFSTQQDTINLSFLSCLNSLTQRWHLFSNLHTPGTLLQSDFLELLHKWSVVLKFKHVYTLCVLKCLRVLLGLGRAGRKENCGHQLGNSHLRLRGRLRMGKNSRISCEWATLGTTQEDLKAPFST